MDHLVLYDGVCGLCNRAVRYILRHDQRRIFKFASIQSKTGRDILIRHGYFSDDLDSFILIVNHDSDEERLLSHSTAALYVLAELGGWRYLAGILRQLPISLRDWFYRLLARHRYGWFGKLDSCPLTEDRYRDRFIDQ